MTDENGFPTLVNEGQRLLLAVPWGQAVKRIGRSKASVSLWRHGKRVPDADARRLIFRCFDIPIEAWDVPPVGTVPEPALVSPPPVEVAAPLLPTPAAPPPVEEPKLATKLAKKKDPLELAEDLPLNSPKRASRPDTKLATRDISADSIEEANDIIRRIRADMARGNLMPNEMNRLRDSEQRALAFRSKLEKERELLEDRVVRDHPAWKRLEKTIIAALRPYPEALRAVAQAIEEAL